MSMNTPALYDFAPVGYLTLLAVVIALAPLAWLWLRHQPDSALSRWFRTRTANAGKRAKRVAIVALARKLIVALWRYLTTGLIPEQATMKA